MLLKVPLTFKAVRVPTAVTLVTPAIEFVVSPKEREPEEKAVSSSPKLDILGAGEGANAFNTSLNLSIGVPIRDSEVKSVNSPSVYVPSSAGPILEPLLKNPYKPLEVALELILPDAVIVVKG